MYLSNNGYSFLLDRNIDIINSPMANEKFKKYSYIIIRKGKTPNKTFKYNKLKRYNRTRN